MAASRTERLAIGVGILIVAAGVAVVVAQHVPLNRGLVETSTQPSGPCDETLVPTHVVTSGVAAGEVYSCLDNNADGTFQWEEVEIRSFNRGTGVRKELPNLSVCNGVALNWFPCPALSMGSITASNVGCQDCIDDFKLKDIDVPADEECLTYEVTGDGFEWQTCGAGGGTPGGADTQVQFNDAGAFGGDSGLTYNKTTNTVTLGDNTAADIPLLFNDDDVDARILWDEARDDFKIEDSVHLGAAANSKKGIVWTTNEPDWSAGGAPPTIQMFTSATDPSTFQDCDADGTADLDHVWHVCYNCAEGTTARSNTAAYQLKDQWEMTYCPNAGGNYKVEHNWDLTTPSGAITFRSMEVVHDVDETPTATIKFSGFRDVGGGLNDPSLYINANGNVGVGTTDISSDLEVGGGGRIELTGTAPGIRLEGETDDGNYVQINLQSDPTQINTFRIPNDRMTAPGGVYYPPVAQNTAMGILQGLLSFDPPSLAAGTTSVHTVTVTGLAANDMCFCSVRGSFSGTKVFMTWCRGSAVDTMQIELFNHDTSAQDPAAKTLDYLCFDLG